MEWNQVLDLTDKIVLTQQVALPPNEFVVEGLCPSDQFYRMIVYNETTWMVFMYDFMYFYFPMFTIVYSCRIF